ncbi:MAG: transcription-repair coupling factor [Ignavibacteria bacterium]|nr:transcription-repair coupling factor [Ignavibacteria bacterium]
MISKTVETEVLYLFEKAVNFSKIKEIVANGTDCGIRFLHGSSKSFVIYLLRKNFPNKRFILLVPDEETLNKFALDLNSFFGLQNVLLLTSFSISKFRQIPNEKLELSIYEKLYQYSNHNDSILILTPEILDFQVPKPKTFAEERIELALGMSFPYDSFIGNLILKGFERKDFVEEQGDIAVRGAIVDIFPLGLDNPVRIEFFGDEIESIRLFDLETQRSIEKLDRIEIITTLFHQKQESTTIYEYFDNDDLFVVDSLEKIEQLYPETSINFLQQKFYINSLFHFDFEVKTKETKASFTSVRNFTKEFLKLFYQRYKVYFASDGDILSERLKEIVSNAIQLEYETNLEQYEEIFEPDEILSKCIWFNKPLSEGFYFEESPIAVFVEHQIFGRERTRITSFKGKGISLKELSELNIGDFVVHVDKGIAKFDGLQKVKFGESYQDCVRLIFADDDIVYLNLNFLHKLQKYRAEDGVTPKLSKLGTNEWERKKQRIKERLKKDAYELIKLYAERKLQKGYAFPPDTIWQKEFEASFVYEDTIDQAKATEDVKRDMESFAPMDRLICGDVGFGKTEVAIRAAFKAVQAGKQVAVLVPTTILASQHEVTFKERLKNYPINIESLSRFKTKKQIEDILQKLSQGSIDIIIGTHRLLSDDVKFKDLGLLIIDEEHRFGVAAKEKLRKLKVNVDTMTMTATPIPRTLNFSLLGVRDLSIMETPPRNRLPIYTEIIYWEEEIIRKAIIREIARDGQIFFVVDKISHIDVALQRLLKIVPNVKIAVAHAKLKNTELEKVMTDFIHGKYNILLTTKIVESGLDIPKANTIFIYNAQNFGLAELYQLRGRVGRTNIQAFCYLIIPPLNTLPRKALQRLQALEEYTDLGSGLKLALRDLEIRGAGDIFGYEQSGFINEIGFEMYQKILDEAIRELKTTEFKDLFPEQKEDVGLKFLKNEELQIEVEFDAFIPSNYIQNEIERFKFYKLLYNVRTPEQLNSLQNELIDKFGPLPKEVENLLKIVSLRIKAFDTGIQKIVFRSNILTIEFPDETNREYYDLLLPTISEFAMSFENAKLIQQKDKLYIKAKVNSFNQVLEIIWRFKKTIESLVL